MTDLSINLSVNLCGIELKNPVIAASGTFGFGREYAKYYDIAQLGGISLKGMTRHRRTGNAPVRIAETPAGMLNAVGLQNPGVDAFLARDLAWLLAKNTAIIANIAGETVEDYCAVAKALRGSGVHMLELNISCPNVRHGGAAFGTSADSVWEITRAVKTVADIPLMVKLTPNVTDIAEMALAAQEGGADAISLINTLLGMAVDAKARRAVLANRTGGLSGPAIKPIALRMVYDVAQAVHIPVVGMGGIITGEDAAEFMLCGATAVMVGTANIADVDAGPRIIRELERFAAQQGIRNIAELTGGLR